MPSVSSLLPWSPRALVVSAALAACAGACSATLDFTECHDDSDCASFFDDNKPMFCSASVCKVREGGCDANTQCAGLGEAYICTNSTTTRECASTETEQCGAPIYPGGEVADDVVFMGLMVPRDGVDATIGQAIEKAALAAIADFNGAGELQSGGKVAAVVCNTKSDPKAASDAAKHLGDSLTIPVFVGPVDDLEFTKVVKEVTFAPRVNAFTMGPMVTAALDELDTSNLVFSAMSGAKYQGRALGARLAVDIAGEPVDTLFLLANNEYGRSLYQSAATESTGEGKPQRIPELEGNQLLSSYDNVDGAMTFIKGQIEGGKTPAVLILFGRSEVAEILKRYKAAGYKWPEKVYVSHRAIGAIEALGDATLAPLVVALAPEFDAKLAALRMRVGDAALPAEAALAYDATMTSLLAMAAVKAGDPVVGLKIAAAVGKLTDKTGAKIDFTGAPATFLTAAKAAFAAGKGVDVSGFSGALDFDANGEICGPIGAYKLDAAGKKFEKFAVFTPDCPATTGTWADLP
jgi:ABC-type branched-subunit amino acid transport system substrate-binding protein